MINLGRIRIWPKDCDSLSIVCEITSNKTAVRKTKNRLAPSREFILAPEVRAIPKVAIDSKILNEEMIITRIHVVKGVIKSDCVSKQLKCFNRRECGKVVHPTMNDDL